MQPWPASRCGSSAPSESQGLVERGVIGKIVSLVGRGRQQERIMPETEESGQDGARTRE
jgi:hypothetical protein